MCVIQWDAEAVAQIGARLEHAEESLTDAHAQLRAAGGELLSGMASGGINSLRLEESLTQVANLAKRMRSLQTAVARADGLLSDAEAFAERGAQPSGDRRLGEETGRAAFPLPPEARRVDADAYAEAFGRRSLILTPLNGQRISAPLAPWGSVGWTLFPAPKAEPDRYA